MQVLVALSILAACAGAYMVPAIVAHARKHPNRTAITVLTIFAGWTVAGWIVGLVWASTRVEGGTEESSRNVVMSLVFALVLPLALALLFGAINQLSLQAPETPTAIVDKFAVSQTVTTSTTIRRLIDRKVIVGVWGSEAAVYVVAGPRFGNLTAAERATAISDVGRELAGIRGADALVVYAENGDELIGTWNRPQGYRGSGSP